MLLAATLLAVATPLTPFVEVVAAERAFAADARVAGLHDAFLAHLSVDAVVIEPVPASGRAAHEGKPPAKGTLSWGPAWAAVAASGDLGLSSGPAEYRVPGEADPSYTGWFFSVWKKQADGVWKVRADIGISCPLTFAAPPSVEDGLAGPGAVAPAANRRSIADARMRLRAEESRLAGQAKDGMGAALAPRIDDATRIHRDGRCPATGAAGREVAASDTRKLDCKPERIELAPSGDLGFAYGTCARVGGGPAETTGYLRAWRRAADGSFKVLVDVVLDVPERK